MSQTLLSNYRILTTLVIFLLHLGFTCGRLTNQFAKWYPEYGAIFEDIRDNNCTEPYQAYLNSTVLPPSWDSDLDVSTRYTAPVVLCILNYTDEFIKSSMSSAQVLLGLSPTALALMAPSTEELNLLSIGGGRPIFATLLALSSPCVFVSRAFEFVHPIDMLKKGRGGCTKLSSCSKLPSLFSVGQYFLVFVAIANIVHLSYELGTQTICIFWPDGQVAPAVWYLLSLPVHLVGGVAMRMRVRRGIYYCEERNMAKRQWLRQWFIGLPQRVRRVLQTEKQPAVTQESIYITVFRDSPSFVYVSWFLSVGMVAQIIVGTLSLSSLNFIGPRDALIVVLRYMASVFLAKILSRYELLGLRERCDKIIVKFQDAEAPIQLDPESASLSMYTSATDESTERFQPTKQSSRNSLDSLLMLPHDTYRGVVNGP